MQRHLPSPSQLYSQRVVYKVEELGREPVPITNAGITGSTLICYTTLPASICERLRTPYISTLPWEKRLGYSEFGDTAYTELAWKTVPYSSLLSFILSSDGVCELGRRAGCGLYTGHGEALQKGPYAGAELCSVGVAGGGS